MNPPSFHKTKQTKIVDYISTVNSAHPSAPKPQPATFQEKMIHSMLEELALQESVQGLASPTDPTDPADLLTLKKQVKTFFATILP